MLNETFEKMTLVLLQTDEESARYNRDRFTELGMEVLGVCGSGLDAVRVITELQPDVVLMDSFLPGRSSYEVIESLKSVGYRKNTVLAVMSQVPNDRLAQQVMDAGGDLFILPPLDYQFIRDRFMAIIDKKRAGVEEIPDDGRFLRAGRYTGCNTALSFSAALHGCLFPECPYWQYKESDRSLQSWRGGAQ